LSLKRHFAVASPLRGQEWTSLGTPRRLTFALHLSLEPSARHARNDSLRYLFEDFALDTDRRELRRGADVVPTTPQVFDLLDYLIRHREPVVSKDALINPVWQGT